MKLRTGSVVFVSLFLVACQSGKRTVPVPAPGPATAASEVAPGWLRVELVFAFAPAEAEGLGLAAAEGSWRAFVDEEVAPRFPDGFTVLEGYGRWPGAGAAPAERERSKVLVVVQRDTPERRAAIDVVREAYKRRIGEQPVWVIETPAREPRP